MTEQLLVIIAMLVGGVVFGYIVGVFAGIISSQDQQKKRNREEIRDLDALAKESRLPKAKAKELRSFFKFLVGFLAGIPRIVCLSCRLA